MIRVVHPGPGSGCWLSTHPRSRIQGSKRYQIPDPDPQHWLYICSDALEACRSNIQARQRCGSPSSSLSRDLLATHSSSMDAPSGAELFDYFLFYLSCSWFLYISYIRRLCCLSTCKMLLGTGKSLISAGSISLDHTQSIHFFALDSTFKKYKLIRRLRQEYADRHKTEPISANCLTKP